MVHLEVMFSIFKLEFSIHLFQLYTILKSKTRYSKMTEQLRMEIINKVAEVRMY